MAKHFLVGAFCFLYSSKASAVGASCARDISGPSLVGASCARDISGPSLVGASVFAGVFLVARDNISKIDVYSFQRWMSFVSIPN